MYMTCWHYIVKSQDQGRVVKSQKIVKEPTGLVYCIYDLLLARPNQNTNFL